MFNFQFKTEKFFSCNELLVIFFHGLLKLPSFFISTGIPHPTVEWFKNGQKLYNADRVQQINDAHGSILYCTFFITT